MADKAEEQILFPEIKVGNMIVKPWTFGILFEISELLEIVLDKMNDKGILENINPGMISYIDIARIFSIASSELLKIISITVDKPEEDLRKLTMEDGIKLTLAIYRQNTTVLKNVLSSLFREPIETNETETNKT